MARILHGPDLHCFYDTYGRLDAQGMNTRFLEWLKLGQALLQIALEERVDLAIFPGDLFKNSRPTDEQRLAVFNLFNSFHKHGIPVVAIDGNHDKTAPGKPGPVDLFGQMIVGHWGITRPQVVNMEGIQVACLPFVKPSALNAQEKDPAKVAQEVGEKLIHIARGLKAQCTGDGPTILVGHYTIGGSATSSGQVMVGGNAEPILPLSALLEIGFDLYAFGHIHKPQTLHQEPFVGYAGALQRVDFGEEKDPRGCWIHDTETHEHVWKDIPAMEFKTITRENYMTTLREMTGRIVRAKLKFTEEESHGINTDSLVKEIQSCNPEFFAGIHVDVEKTERIREASVTETTTPREALAKWLTVKGYSPELQELVLQEFDMKKGDA